MSNRNGEKTWNDPQKVWAVSYPINQNIGKSLWVRSLKRAIKKDSRDEKQKIFMGMWLGAMMDPMGFIMRKLGLDALEELNDESAKGCAADLKERGVDDPLKFAMSYAVINKNIFY